jgi:hypothetical protein
MDRVKLLSAAQRRALTSARAEVFLVALAKLNLLTGVMASWSSSTPPP